MTDLMVLSANSKCSNLHDKAFSLLGLASDPTIIDINYKVPRWKIVLDLLDASVIAWSLQKVQRLFESLEWSTFKTRLVQVCARHDEDAEPLFLEKDLIAIDLPGT